MGQSPLLALLARTNRGISGPSLPKPSDPNRQFLPLGGFIPQFEDDPDPSPSRYGLALTPLAILTGAIVIWSFVRAW